MQEGKFFNHEIEFLQNLDFSLPNGEIPAIENMLDSEQLEFYNSQSLDDKGLVNSDINFALQKGFRFLQQSPYGTPWNPRLRLEHVGLTIPYRENGDFLYETVKNIMNNISLPTRIIIGNCSIYFLVFSFLQIAGF
jgi:hypothetical protein